MKVFQNKNEVLEHQTASMEFVDSLKEVSEEVWRSPVEEGKWTIAEVVGHFPAWDQFVMEKRLPYLFTSDPLPKGPDVEKMNAVSADHSRRVSRQETLHSFKAARSELYKQLESIPYDQWGRTFTIGSSTLTLCSYFNGLAEHDRHHFDQIKRVIR